MRPAAMLPDWARRKLDKVQREAQNLRSRLKNRNRSSPRPRGGRAWAGRETGGRLGGT